MLQQYCDIMQVQIAATTKAKNKMQKRDKKEKKNINHSTILKTSIILYLMQHLLVVATLLQHSQTCACTRLFVEFLLQSPFVRTAVFVTNHIIW